MLRETAYRVAGLLFWAGVGLGLLSMLPGERQQADYPSAVAGASHADSQTYRR